MKNIKSGSTDVFRGFQERTCEIMQTENIELKKKTIKTMKGKKAFKDEIIARLSFEDCEKILLNRDHNYNPTMSILLNLTDGIISDILNIKIICTFNTALSNIDKALLRKGRLTLKYEFKKLAKEKVKKLLPDENITQDMSLADIYNFKEENDYSKKQQNKIGF